MEKKAVFGVDKSEFFESVFKNARKNAVIILDEHGIILQISESFQNLFGFDEDIIGKNFKILFTPKDQKMQLPEKELATVKQEGFANDNNYLINSDGKSVWVSGESVLIRKEKDETFIVKIFQDIHTQKTLEHTLTESHAFVDSILHCITDALVVVDTDIRILKANKAFYKTFQIPEETLEGILLYDLNYSFWNDSRMQEKLEAVISEQDYFGQNEFTWHKPDGNRKTMKLNATLLKQKNEKAKRILLVISDITYEKNAEQQREDVIRFVSHELRNPLANMALCLELLDQCIHENNADDALEYLNKTKINIRRLNNVISELHDATMAGSGNLRIEKKPFSFEEFVDEAIETVKFIHPTHRIIKSGDAAITVSGDPYRLTQVLINYLTNAIKYSPDADKIMVHVSHDKKNIVLSVTDFGYGVDQDKIPHVYERYFRADNTQTEGMGLGLFLSKEIIHAHEGRVWVESEKGKGSTFYFSIPVKKEDPES